MRKILLGSLVLLSALLSGCKRITSGLSATDPLVPSQGVEQNISVEQDSRSEGWKTYTVILPNFPLRLSSPYGKPRTSLSELSGYKGDFGAGFLYVLDANANKFFSLQSKPCPETISESRIICVIPGKDWYQENDKEEIDIHGNKAISYYLFEPTTNSVLHVVQFEKIPVQLSMAVDGAGQDQDFKKIVDSVVFVQ